MTEPDSDKDGWLTIDDVSWRPESDLRPLNWRDLRFMWKRAHSAHEMVGTGALILEVANRNWRELDESAYMMMGHKARPRSVRLNLWLRRTGLPTFGLGWRTELWYRMLLWEHREWAFRTNELSPGGSHARSINTLTRVLPKSALQHRTAGIAEAEILSSWLVLRGRRLNKREFAELLGYYGFHPL